MKNPIPLLLLLLASTAAQAGASVLALYQFSDAAGTDATRTLDSFDTHADSVASALGLSAAIGPVGSASGKTIYVDSGDEGDALLTPSNTTTDGGAGAVNTAASYFEFSLNPSTGTSSYSSLTFRASISDTNSARNTFYKVRATTDPTFTTSTLLTTSPANYINTPYTTVTSDLTSLGSLSGTVYFRILFAEQGAASSTTLGNRIDNITLNGEVPEPAALGLLAFAASAMLLSRRRAQA